MWLLLFKTIHIVGAISWFAAMFYLGRMFVYHKEALEKNNSESPILIKQYSIMEWRVYKIIMNPAMVITWVCGLAMLYIHGMEWFRLNMWMHHKLLLLLVLSAYHGYSKKMIRNIQSNTVKLTSFQFRLFNEFPTIMLFLITPFAVYKNSINPVYLFVSIISLIILLVLFTILYKKNRLKNEHSN
jgi:protoporphyrinogen IX oxidase